VIDRDRVARNTLILTGIRIGAPLSSFVVVLAISWFLGAEALGRYTIASTWLALILAVTPLGLDGLLLREGARDPEALSTTLTNGSALTLGSSCGLMAALAGISVLLPYDPGTVRAVLLASLSLPSLALLSVFEASFAARQRTEFIALPRIAEAAVKVAAAFPLVVYGYGLDAVLMAAALGSTLAALTSWFLLRRIDVRLNARLDFGVVRRLATTSPTFMLIGLAAILYWRVDVLLLSALQDVEEVGLYGAAYRVLEVAKIAPQSLCLAVYPQLARAAVSNAAGVRKLGDWTMRHLAALTLPIALGGLIAPQAVLSALYGEAFETAHAALSILALAILPYAWVRYHAYVLVAAERQRIDLLLNVVLLAVNVVLNLALIPRYGASGAAAATALAISIYGAAQSAYLHRYLPSQMARLGGAAMPLAAALIMAAGVWSVRSLGPLVQLAGGVALYALTLRSFGFFGAALNGGVVARWHEAPRT
jgi:O-antigen/teichoic acid export membrane protein